MTTPSWVLPLMDAMVANTIGDISPQKYMNTIVWEDLPEDLPLHRSVLKSVEWCMGKDLKPMPETILGHMKSEDIEGAKEFIEDVLLPIRDEDQSESLRSTSAILFNWLKSFQADEAWGNATDVWNGSGTYSEKMKSIETLLNRIKPDSERIYQYTQRELWEEFLSEMRELTLNQNESGEVGARLPYEAADAFMSRFKPREISSFMAYTGWGKTMFMMDMAEYMAWVQEFECDVVVILLETDPINIQKRQFSKKAIFPYSALETGKIDIDNGEYSDKFKLFQKRYINRNKTGRIHYCYIPEPTIGSVLTAMDIYSSMIQRTTGRFVYFMIDYLQKIQTSYGYENQKKHEFYERCVELIASKTRVISRIYEGIDAHTMIFAQENPDTGETFGTKTLKQKSQMMFSLKRFNLEGTSNADRPMMNGDEPKLDSMGNERYWHRKDSGLSSMAELHCVKANDAAPFTINLNIETNMGIINQDRSQLKRLRSSGELSTRRGKGEKNRDRR